jgi:hypothetical protein
MAIVSVNLVDTFDEWRVKTNTLGNETGDLTSLSTTNKSSIVAAINEVNTNADLSLKNIVEDTSPQLGGDLDLNGSDITNSNGTSGIDINGNIVTTGEVSGSQFNGVIEVYSDNSPILGGDLNLSKFDGVTLLSSYDIVGTGNINITGDITATGAVAGATLSGAWSGNLNGDLGLNSNNITGTGNINITGSLTATSIAGTVVGVTQSPSDNSTKLATTAYVDAQVETENTLDEMNDTNLNTPSDGQTLTYDAASQKWINNTPPSAGISLALAIAVG